MYLNQFESIEFFNSFLKNNFDKDVKIVICPSYVNLFQSEQLISKYDNIYLGSQNVSCHKTGAYTGDISINMLEKLDCQFTIIGHSERRLYHDENNSIINKKLNILNESSINPIICIGETLEEKNTGKTFEVLSNQINQIFSNIKIHKEKKYILAYEPIWAIGTGISAELKIINSVHNYIKNFIKDIGKNYCNLSLLYGGSVSENNASDILEIENVDGFLIGSSSINPEKFYNIYNQF